MGVWPELCLRGFSDLKVYSHTGTKEAEVKILLVYNMLSKAVRMAVRLFVEYTVWCISKLFTHSKGKSLFEYLSVIH